ncbi:hypothetical protein VSU19_12565, partial [Verrucomicrobiales bacterium BCK34]|nr:hypothetical protein [Verrucomicrobiales bacterium BCK34]
DGNRPVRTRMPGGVGGAGSIPVPTRFGVGYGWAFVSPNAFESDIGPFLFLSEQSDSIGYKDLRGASDHCFPCVRNQVST